MFMRLMIFCSVNRSMPLMRAASEIFPWVCSRMRRT